MNWLAHFYLSEPDPEFQLGSILPDIAPAKAIAHLPPRVQRGIQRHHQVDAFTDAHPVFRRSAQRLPPPYRRYGPVLVDIFYDHFLARDWSEFSRVPLPQFTSEIYAAFDCHADALPPKVQQRLQQIRDADLLTSYRSVPGIARALAGLSRRLRRPFDLAPAARALEQAPGQAMRQDFHDFFPDLQAHLQRNDEPRSTE